MNSSMLHGLVTQQHAGSNKTSASYSQFDAKTAQSQESMNGQQPKLNANDSNGNNVAQQNDPRKNSSASTVPNKTFNAAAETSMPSSKPAAPMLTANNAHAVQPDSKATSSSSPLKPDTTAATNDVQAANKVEITPGPVSSPAAGMHFSLVAPNQTVSSSVYTAQVPVLSPDHVYSAFLIDQHVIIKQGDATILVSKTNLLPSDSLTSLKWSSNTVLVYEVLSNGVTRTYQIDLQTKTETEIPSN